MAKTPSNMLALSTKAPDFTLLDTVSGQELSLKDLASEKGTMIMFICNHCPFVIHLHDQLTQMIKEYSAKGIQCIAISANDIENYPDDSPEKMKELAEKLDWNIPYLYDQTQEVAKAYQAACTPDFYLFNGDLELVYRGQFCDSRPGSEIPVTGKDLRAAMDALLAGAQIPSEQRPSLGCNIKWISA